MSQQPFKEVRVDPEVIMEFSDPPDQDSDEHQPPTPQVALDPDPYEYPWIRAWHTYLGSSPGLIDQQVRQAQHEHAHHTAVNRFDEGDWMTLFDIYAPEARLHFVRWVEDRPGLHLPREVLEAWLDPAPERPDFSQSWRN